MLTATGGWRGFFLYFQLVGCSGPEIRTGNFFILCALCMYPFTLAPVISVVDAERLVSSSAVHPSRTLAEEELVDLNSESKSARSLPGGSSWKKCLEKVKKGDWKNGERNWEGMQRWRENCKLQGRQEKAKELQLPERTRKVLVRQWVEVRNLEISRKNRVSKETETLTRKLWTGTKGNYMQWLGRVKA